MELLNGKITLGDSIGPDEYRLWPKDFYGIGKTQKSFDKQILRDWLSEKRLPKNSLMNSEIKGEEPIPPSIPKEIIEKNDNAIHHSI